MTHSVLRAIEGNVQYVWFMHIIKVKGTLDKVFMLEIKVMLKQLVKTCVVKLLLS